MKKLFFLLLPCGLIISCGGADVSFEGKALSSIIEDVEDVQDAEDEQAVDSCAEKVQVGSYEDAGDFILTGSAEPITPYEFQLTPNCPHISGAVNSKEKIADFSKSFSLTFDLYLGGGDGIAIVFHNNPEGAYYEPLVTGGDLGVGGMEHAIALEVDTVHNGGGDHPRSKKNHGQIYDTDIGSGHATWGSRGALTDPIGFPESLQDGNYHPVVVKWNHVTKTLVYTVSGHLAGEYQGEIRPYINNSNKAYISFTGATGSFRGLQKFRNMSINFE